MDPDPDPVGPKTYGLGSATMLVTRPPYKYKKISSFFFPKIIELNLNCLQVSAATDEVGSSERAAFLLIFKSLLCAHTERICREFFTDQEERLDQLGVKPLVLQMAEQAVLSAVSSIG